MRLNWLLGLAAWFVDMEMRRTENNLGLMDQIFELAEI